MKFNLQHIAAFAFICCTTSAFAITDQEATAQGISLTIQPTKPGFHVVINGGLTYGGDTIATAVYTNGKTTDIKGGALIQFGAGAQYQLEEKPIALMLSANYHLHTAMGQNGDITFSRVPIEALAYYTGKERFRIGGGVRVVNSPEFNASVNGITDKIIFDNSTGLVAEIGYQLSTQGWLNFRFVSEKYNANRIIWNSGSVTSIVGLTKPVSGSHLGMNFSYEF
jgi:hypothetical protein